MKVVFIRGLLLLAVAGCLFAQQANRRHIPITIEDILRQQAEPKSQNELNERLRSMAAVTRFSQDYLLGPGDVIEVTVFGIEELKMKQLTLDSEGKVYLPFINEVRLMGLTPRESEVKIATLYEASVMKNPQVSISVKEYRSQFINVLGAVYKPGTYQLTRRTYLVDALAMAGGLLAEKAESTAYIHRTGQNEETIEVDLVQLLERGNIDLNVPVYSGDVVSVPERVERFFYVLGDVNRGGAFEMKRGETITLSQALASAGGLMTTAKSSKASVMRQLPDGSSQQIPVDIKKVLRGQSVDIEIAQNDVVFIPGSTTKTIGKGILNGLGNVLAAFVYVGVR